MAIFQYLFNIYLTPPQKKQKKNIVYKNRHPTGGRISKIQYSHPMGYYSRIKRKEITNTCYNMGESQMHSVKGKKPVIKVTYTV